MSDPSAMLKSMLNLGGNSAPQPQQQHPPQQYDHQHHHQHHHQHQGQYDQQHQQHQHPFALQQQQQQYYGQMPLQQQPHHPFAAFTPHNQPLQPMQPMQPMQQHQQFQQQFHQQQQQQQQPAALLSPTHFGVNSASATTTTNSNTQEANAYESTFPAPAAAAAAAAEQQSNPLRNFFPPPPAAHAPQPSSSSSAAATSPAALAVVSPPPIGSPVAASSLSSSSTLAAAAAAPAQSFLNAPAITSVVHGQATGASDGGETDVEQDAWILPAELGPAIAIDRAQFGSRAADDNKASNKIKAETVTFYPSELTFSTGHLVAANEEFMAYALKMKAPQSAAAAAPAAGTQVGTVRVLHIATGKGALVRGHTAAAILDMAFASSGSAASGLPDLESSGRRHVLASIDRDGTVVVSRISFAADGNLVVTSILHVPTDNVIKSFPRHRLAWSPASIAHPGLCLVVAYGSLCTLWKVDDILAANNGNPVQATRAQLQPNWVTFIRSDQKQQLINDLAFSADGTVLLTCGGESVQFWRTETGQLLHDWAPHGKQTVLSVLPMGNGTNSVDQLAHTQAQMMPLLVTASSLNHEIKLWRSRDLQLLQTLRFDSPPATTTGVPLGLQLALDPTFCFVSTGLLLVADQHRKSLYALGLAATGSHGSPALSYRFSTLTEFHLTDALISFIVARSAVTFDVTSPQEMNVHFDFQLIVKDPKVIQQLAVRYRPVSRPHATAIRALKASAPLPSSAAPVQHPPASTTPPSLEHSAAPSPVAAAATASGAAGPTAAVSAPHNVGGDGKLPAWLTTSSGATASSSLPASLTDSTERGLNLSGANTVRPTRQPNGAGTGKGFATGSAVAAPVSEALLHQMRDEIHQSQEHTLNLVQQLIAQQQKQAEKDREDAAQLAAQTTIRAISSEFQKLIVPLVQQTVSASVKQTVTELVPSIAAQAANLVAESATTTALANKPLAENVAKLIASSLRNPIQEAFRSTFQQNVIPALDRALQQTMQQVNATFDQGTRDYLQQLYALDGAKTGAALNSQQLQAFAVSIQQSVQQASAECQRSTTAAVDVSLARVQKDLREIVVSRKSDRKERSDRSSSSANQSSAALSASSLDGAAASAMQQQGATPLPASASATALAPAPAATSDKERLWQHIAELVAAQEFDKAFSEALGATDLAVLMRLCSGIPVATIFGQSPVPLSPAILLSLVQQLSFDLSRDIETKISYLQPAVLALDSSNSMVQRHAPVVLKSANRKLKEWLVLPQSATSSLSASIKLMVMLIERLLERCEAPGAEGNARPL